MDLNLGAVVQALAGLIPGVVALLGLTRGPGSLRSKLTHDVEMLSKLPEGSPARSKLLEYVETEIDTLALYETKARRNWTDFGLALTFSVGFVALTIWLLTCGEWWGWVLGVISGVVTMALLSIMFESAQRVPRDHKGKAL